MGKILLTSFEEFGPLDFNPSKAVVEELDGQEICGKSVETLIVPVAFGKCFEKVEDYLEAERDVDMILNIGVYGKGRVEVAKAVLNLRNAPYPDNEGLQPSDELIREQGKNAYFSDMPFHNLKENMDSNEIAFDIAPTPPDCFVCNNLSYLTADYIEDEDLDIIHGIVHIPLSPENNLGDKPSVPIKTSVESVKTIIKNSLAN